MKIVRPVSCFLLLASLFSAVTSDACTIFVKGGGPHILVGNNEDNGPDTARNMWFHQKTAQSLGYVMWGSEEQYPEGGMNDHGLFFDAAALPTAIPIVKHADRKDLNQYAVAMVLASSPTVADALALLARYNLVEQEKAQIFLADSTGDYAVVHANYVVRKKDSANYVLTNYSLDLPPQDQPVCWRRNTASRILQDGPSTLVTITEALQQTAQRDMSNVTIYSQAIDLTTRQFLLYVDRNFESPVRLDLDRELARGDHSVHMADLLPPTLKARSQQIGLSSALLESRAKHDEEHPQLRLTALSNEASVLGAIGREDDAAPLFQQVLRANPDDYSSELLSASNGNVHFRMAAFPNASQVAIAANFNQWSTKALQLRRDGDYWVGDVHLAPGRYQYVVYVDGTWQTDPLNRLAVPRGKYWASLLVVPARVQ